MKGGVLIPKSRKVEIKLTPYQWRMVKASAKKWKIPAKDFEAHAAYLLQQNISMLRDELEQDGIAVPPRVLDYDIR